MKRIRQWRSSWLREPKAVRREKAVTAWFASISAVMFLLCGGFLVPPLWRFYQEDQRITRWMSKRDLLLSPSSKGRSLSWAEAIAGQKLEVIKDAKKIEDFLENRVHPGDEVNSIALFDLTCETNGVRASAFCLEEAVLFALDKDQKILWTKSLKSTV